MVQSLQVMLEGLFDYAGLFPPAQLDLPAAWAEFSRHKGADEAFLVERFACPAASLLALAQLIPPGAEVSVTVIGSGDPAADARLAQAAEEAHPGLFTEAYETRLPAGESVRPFSRKLSAWKDHERYLELPLDASLRDHLHELADTDLSAKARLGGTAPGSHPAAPAVADFILECLDLGLDFKLTAGLHHPFPTTDPTTGDRMHGFLNVLMTTALAQSHEFSRPELARVLESNAFDFSESGANWEGHFVPTEALDSMRESLVGIGSCSIAEPKADLIARNLW